ncbi:MAG: DUF2142 domain-containing protein [Acidobacteriota bacterium]|nr:DUF2142 domain-containing protein [Acidobacteriota bacterium]
MSPDEPWHFARAYEISGGTFLGGDGGYLDKGILQLWDYISAGQIPPEVHYSTQFRKEAGSIPWTGNLVFQEFPNIAQYPPTGYLPQALGIIIGKMAGAGVVRTLAISRIFNALTAILICTCALFMCRAGKLFMFTILLLPMSLGLFASVSQDAALIALAALAFAIISRQLAQSTPLSRGKLLLLLILFLVISLGRPPYAALTLILFIPGLLPRWGKLPAWLTACACIATNVLVVVAWWLFTLSRMHVFAHPASQGGQYSASLQLWNLIHHPELAFQLVQFSVATALATLAAIIGLVGWRTTMVPLLYYPAMMSILAIATAAEIAGHEETGRKIHRLIFASFAITVLAIYFIEYLTWTEVGAAVIFGVQGRYFLPVAIALGLGIHGHRPSNQTFNRLAAVVIAAQLLTCICLPYSIYMRFYVH